MGELLSRLTGGRYTAARRKLDESGTLQVRLDDEQWREPHQLSRGTREQLYLAIRLAFVHQYCQDNESLPMVMDDILVNFDDQRCRHTLQVLADISQTQQVIFLTCHDNMVERVTNVLPQSETLRLGEDVLAGEQAV